MSTVFGFFRWVRSWFRGRRGFVGVVGVGGNGLMRSRVVCSGLWSFLAAWRGLFDRFDEDRSGYISLEEYSKALVAFGYNLSAPFVGMMFSLYDRRNVRSLSFDLFVQSCISLKRMTDVFKKYDTDRDGFITLSFEEFLMGRFDGGGWKGSSANVLVQRY